MKKIICLFLVLVLFFVGCSRAESVETTVEQTESQKFEEPIIKDSYYFALINSEYLNQNDRNAINAIIDSYSNHEVYVIDVKGIPTASEIYDVLKAEMKNKNGKLDGIQIFGTADMIPSFIVDYKIEVRDEISTNSSFFSDYLYSNFNNDSADLAKFNIVDNFSSESPIDLTPQWRVARLMLGSGEFANYAITYSKFLSDNPKVGIASFSSSIFRYSQTASVDDFAHFFTRARDEWKIIDSVKLYANKKGDCITAAEIIDDISLPAFSEVNKQGVFEFFISGHGSQRGIIRTYFEGNKENNDYFITFAHINSYFKSNPFFLNLHACNPAEGLDYNFVREALNNNCLGAFAATSYMANNGIDCRDSLEEMQSSGNFFYFYYQYLNALNNTDRSHALLEAQQSFESILSERSKQEIDYSANYQCGYQNLLCYLNFGILEPDADSITEFEVDETEAPIKAFGKDFVVITQGIEVGDSVSLSVEAIDYGTKNYFALSKASAILLDNEYVRLTFDAKGKKDSVLYTSSTDLNTIWETHFTVTPDCTISIDIPIKRFKNEKSIVIAFETITNVEVWLITGFDSLIK